MKDAFKKDQSIKFAYIVFLLLCVWWLVLNFLDVSEEFHVYLFNTTYGVMALLGGIWGLTISKKLGYFKSVMGKAILAFSIGLLAQEFGQLVFSAYNILLHVEIPYPSIADIGFFGTIPFYIIGMFYLSKVAGIQFTLHKLVNKVLVILLPIAMLSFSYFFFLQGYEFDFSDPLKIFLDFGYPLGQAFFVSQAVLLYSLSQKILGGVMRSKIMFFVVALVAQYIADYNFLFQTSRGTWENAGYGDLLYLIAYFLMTLAILQLNVVFKKLRHEEGK